MNWSDAPLPCARGALLLAEAVAFGTLIIAALSGNPRPGPRHDSRQDIGRLRRRAFQALAVLGPVWLLLQAADMAAVTTSGQLASAVVLVLHFSQVGHVAMARAGLWLMTALLARRRPRACLVPASLAMALHAASGHAAAAGDTVLLAAVLAHVLAAGAWIGSLPALWHSLARGDASTMVRRYGWLGLGCVCLIALTATVQALALAGGLPGLVGTAYGHVLLLKLALFACLLGLAARHHFVLTAGLPGTMPVLRRSVLVEAGLGTATLLVASLLSSLPPGAHEQPDWPFALRLSLDALQDPDLRQDVARGLLAVTAAAAALFAALTWRSARIPGIGAAAGLLWLAMPHLALLLVPAEPTYYWQSPTGATAASVATGAAAYAAQCAGCHGATGRGDGPLAQGAAIPPANLTAAHLWEHADGELFWWLTAGMRGPDDRLVMPGFADRLDAATRWAVIDFLHANNPYGALTDPGAGRHRH